MIADRAPGIRQDAGLDMMKHHIRMKRRTPLVKTRKLAVPYPTVFICQLPEQTQSIIRKDLERYAHENGSQLSWDEENNDYTAMSGRFCDIEEIYANIDLHFCQTGEDV